MDVKYLYNKNFRALKKKNTGRWKANMCSQTGRVSIVTMVIFPKATYKFSTISIKIPMTFFTKLDKTIQKFT